MMEVTRHASMLVSRAGSTLPATFMANLSHHQEWRREDIGSFWPQSGHTHTQEGNYLILLIRVSLAQEEAEQGACHFEKDSLLGKSLADTMTSFLPPAA